MKATEFCYWLQGFFEIVNINESGLNTGPRSLTSQQVEIIQRHLNLVFKHEIDPSYPNQEELNKIHEGLVGDNFGEICVRC